MYHTLCVCVVCVHSSPPLPQSPHEFSNCEKYLELGNGTIWSIEGLTFHEASLCHVSYPGLQEGVP